MQYDNWIQVYDGAKESAYEPNQKAKTHLYQCLGEQYSRHINITHILIYLSENNNAYINLNLTYYPMI